MAEKLRKPKSRPDDREVVLEALLVLKEENSLPLRAKSRAAVCEALPLRVQLPSSRVFNALQSMHYKYKQVVVARTGCSDGGVARGWHIDLATNQVT